MTGRNAAMTLSHFPLMSVQKPAHVQDPDLESVYTLWISTVSLLYQQVIQKRRKYGCKKSQVSLGFSLPHLNASPSIKQVCSFLCLLKPRSLVNVSVELKPGFLDVLEPFPIFSTVPKVIVKTCIYRLSNFVLT